MVGHDRRIVLRRGGIDVVLAWSCRRRAGAVRGSH
jgi:hypothetical protein